MSDGICFNLIALAAEESRETALEVGQSMQTTLESLLEVGTPFEQQAARFLLKNVNQGIKEILNGELVNVYTYFHGELPIN
jgi:hypothetical protein